MAATPMATSTAVAASASMTAASEMASAHVTTAKASTPAAMGKSVTIRVMRLEMTVVMVVMIPPADKETSVIVGAEIAKVRTERRSIIVANIHARTAAEKKRRGSHSSRQHLVLLRIHNRKKLGFLLSQVEADFLLKRGTAFR